MMDIRADLIPKLIQSGLAVRGQIRGCSEEEIARVETLLGQSFPAQYRQFLSLMGHSAGRFLAGTDTFYGHLPNLHGGALSLLQGSEAKFELPQDAVVFSMHQGYELLYFRTSEGEDPPVYEYMENDLEPTRQWETFSAYLEEAYSSHAEAVKSTARRSLRGRS